MRSAEASGLSYVDALKKIIDLAVERRNRNIVN
jgi:hypothetical protein